MEQVGRDGALVVGLIGAMVLVGWYAGVTQLTTAPRGHESMEPNTAVARVALALAVTRLNRGRLVLPVGVFAVVLGSVTVLEHLFGRSLGIDRLPGIDFGSDAPRMAPALPDPLCPQGRDGVPGLAHRLADTQHRRCGCRRVHNFPGHDQRQGCLRCSSGNDRVESGRAGRDQRRGLDHRRQQGHGQGHRHPPPGADRDRCLRCSARNVAGSILGLAVIAMFSFSWTVEGLLKDHAVAAFSALTTRWSLKPFVHHVRGLNYSGPRSTPAHMPFQLWEAPRGRLNWPRPAQ